MSATVSRRSSAITAIDAGGERSERVSPASVNGLHSVASAGTTASREGRGDARDSVGLTRVASTCTSSSVPWQGDAPPSVATLPLLAVSPSVRVVPLVVSARLPRCRLQNVSKTAAELGGLARNPADIGLPRNPLRLRANRRIGVRRRPVRKSPVENSSPVHPASSLSDPSILPRPRPAPPECLQFGRAFR
jgi:hypothetical protein